MIRRNVPLCDQPTQWLLVDQMAHADVSHRLAELWQAGSGLLTSTHRQETLAAIAHHDDGWLQWDAAPGVRDGTPISFFEMQQEESIAIWQLSIERASECGTLAAHAVAGHFLRLLADSDRPPSREVEQWKLDMAAQQQQWAIQTSGATNETFEQAFRYVRIFDWISLWFCCYAKLNERDITGLDRIEIDEPSCPELRMSLESMEPGVVRVTPWQFNEGEINIALPARVVPKQHYESTDSLLAASTPTTLSWRLQPVTK